MPRPVRTTSVVVVVGLTLAALLSAAPALAADAVGDVPPADIRVCRSGGGVDVVPFEDYVREVLPREFPASMPYETVRAGAVAVKSYAWYYIEHPISDRCDIGDSTRYQKYAPESSRNEPSEVTDRAVRDTWHLRLEDGQGRSLFAQYCSCDHFPDGRHIQQQEAVAMARDGATAEQMLAHFYRDLDPTLLDWRAPFAVSQRGGRFVFGEGEDPVAVTADVDGVAPGDARAEGVLVLACDGNRSQLARAPIADRDGAAVVEFDPTDAANACVGDAALLIVEVRVHDRVVATGRRVGLHAWTSSSDRDVERVAAADDPIAGAVALSFRVFADAGTAEESASEDGGDDGPVDRLPLAADARAGHVVLARVGVFADALSATALAGVDAPILFNPGGQDAQLHPDVRAEIDRVLPEGGRVDLIGGEGALGPAVEEELTDAGYEVVRTSGAERVATSLAVADRLVARDGDPSSVLIARAWPNDSAGWADALSVGAFAAVTGHPVLLTRTEELPPAVADWIDRHPVEEAVVVGGTAAVSSATAEAVPAPTVTRVAGVDRAGTAVAIADELWARDDTPAAARALLIDLYEDEWQFGLAAAVYGARTGGVQLATNVVVPPSSTGAWLDEAPSMPVTVVGGPGVVPPRVEEDAAGDSEP